MHELVLVMSLHLVSSTKKEEYISSASFELYTTMVEIFQNVDYFLKKLPALFPQGTLQIVQ